MNRSEQVKRILADATKAAYERGWNDALKAFEQAATAPAQAVEQRGIFDNVGIAPAHVTRRRGKPSKASDEVLMVVNALPGQSGAFIAKQLPHIHERTVRTVLRRLRIAGRIEQRNKGWFVKHVSGE